MRHAGGVLHAKKGFRWGEGAHREWCSVGETRRRGTVVGVSTGAQACAAASAPPRSRLPHARARAYRPWAAAARAPRRGAGPREMRLAPGRCTRDAAAGRRGPPDAGGARGQARKRTARTRTARARTAGQVRATQACRASARTAWRQFAFHSVKVSCTENFLFPRA